MSTAFSSGTVLANQLCNEGETTGWAAHVCAAGEGETFTVGAGGTVDITVPPRTGYVLVAQ